MAAEDFAVEHAWENDVVGEFCLTDTFCARIDFAERLADDVEWIPVLFTFAHALIESVHTFPWQFVRFTSHSRRCQFNRFIDLDVTSTPAQIS